MASSLRTSEAKFNVFLSFRGEDTRDNFTSHLYAALCSKKIETFIDDDLHRGDEVSPSIFNAIEESKIAIIIFSKGYAASRWCLEELVKILECKKLYDLIAIPVFYHVDPSDVRKQTGPFAEAFAKHEEGFQQSIEKIQKWRAGLKEAANLSGFDSRVIRPEAALIEDIVKNILRVLNHVSPSDNKQLVGVESSIKKIERLLRMESNNVFSLGIWGMGGIGKTTLARAIFTKISNQFESCYFQKNVREESEKIGLVHLCQELLSTILEDKYCILESTFTKSRLRNKKILIVFDDVTCSEQIEKLIGDLECFGPGSRIIITTRDKQVLKNCGVDHANIYEVKGLLDTQALELFSWHAFKLNHPIEDYIELSKKMIRFAKGTPLALKVLGGWLFGKTRLEWESALYKLKRIPNSKVQDVLKISYDGLDDQEKSIFLDIACFFVGANINDVIEILNASGFASEIGVSVLIDKSLITTTNDQKIRMHDLLQDLGQNIVKRESKDPGRRSRLWHHEDIYHVLRKKKGTEAIEGICLDISKIRDINLNRNAFSKMHNLRFFDFYSSNNLGKSFNKMHIIQGLEFVSIDLTYFRWFGYPLKSLPSNFSPENLVELHMPHSNIEQLGQGIQHFEKLKHINLSCSKHLLRIPDLSLVPNLQSLILEGCSSLVEVPTSIQYLEKLVMLNLKDCKNLMSLSNNIQSKFLVDVILSGCSKIKMAPKISSSMERVLLDGTAIQEMPTIESPSRLLVLDLKNCSSLVSLPSTIFELMSLTVLYLSGCSKLTKLPDSLGILSGLCSLSILDVSDCKIMKLPDNLGILSSIYSLNLSGNNFESIPTSIKKLSKLEFLDVSICGKLKSLPELLQVPCIRVQNCKSLKALSDLSFISSVPLLNQEINLANCFNLDLDKLRAKLEKALLKFKLKKYSGQRAAMCFPGNTIPNCFISQMGSSITLKLSHDGVIRSSISFVVCAVVKFREQHYVDNNLGGTNMFPIRFKCISKDRDGAMRPLCERSMYPWKVYDFSRYNLNSDHVFVGYNFFGDEPLGSKLLDLKFDANVTIDFYIDHASKSEECCEVKKCGVRLLSDQDGSEEPVELFRKSFGLDYEMVKEEEIKEAQTKGLQSRSFSLDEAVKMVVEEEKKGAEHKRLRTSRSFSLEEVELEEEEEEKMEPQLQAKRLKSPIDSKVGGWLVASGKEWLHEAHIALHAGND